MAEKEKEEKYVAMIMDRHYLSEDTFLFTPNHIAVGEYLEEEKEFRDLNGNKYYGITDENSMTDQNPRCYAMLEKMGNLRNIIKLDMPMKILVSEYEWCNRNFVYLVGYLEDGTGFYRAINLSELKKDIAESYHPEPDEEEQEEPVIIDKTEEEEKKNSPLNPVNEKIEQLMLNIVNGRYSLSDLKEMKAKAKDNKEDYAELEESIDMQIETLTGKEKVPFQDDIQAIINSVRIMHQQVTPTISIPAIAIPKEQKIIKNNVPLKPKDKVANPYKEEFDIEKIYKEVTKTLIAQDDPAKRVIVEIARKEIDSRKKKEGILLTGPTGVGKTKLMELIAKHSNRPFMKVDSTQLTVPGYVGKDIEEVLYDLYKKCNYDKSKTEKAIIFFDEIDKKGSDKKSDVNGQGVLNVLLPFIEGAEYDAQDDTKHSKDSVKINTANMTVILGGAFSDVYKNLKKQNQVGFTGKQTSIDKPTYREAETKDFVEHGLMTNEFMGRVTVIKLNDLDLKDIKKIMLESDESQLKIQQSIFEKIGVKLKFTDGYIDKVAEKAYSKKTGARALNGIIDETTWKAFEKVYSSDGEYSEVTLDETTVEDNTSYQLVKKIDKK